MDASDDGANSATTMPTHHTHHFAKQVSVEVPPRLCGVTKVLAHHSVHQQSHQFGVPPITVSLVCVCAKCGVEVPMVAMPHTMPLTHLRESHEQLKSQEEGRQVSEWPDGRHASGPCVVDGNAM